MSLTDTVVASATRRDRPYKCADEKGLFLLINPNGSRWWRFAYRFGGKYKSLSLGVYPDVSLDLARAKRDEARALLTEGINPSEVRKQNRLQIVAKIKRPVLQFSITESGGMFVENRNGKMLLSAEQVAALRSFLDATKEQPTCL